MDTLMSQLFSSYRAQLLDLASTRLATKEKLLFSKYACKYENLGNVFLFERQLLTLLLLLPIEVVYKGLQKCETLPCSFKRSIIWLLLWSQKVYLH